MVQLKSLLEGEVCTGENLAQGELQHPQSILLVIVKHLGRGQSQNNSVTKPHRHQHHAGPLVNVYCAFIGLWSHSENWAWDQARYLPSVRGREGVRVESIMIYARQVCYMGLRRP